MIRGLKPGAVVASRFQVKRLLGRGAMAPVFEAEDRETGRQVALKVLQSHGEESEHVKRFEREAVAQSKIRHANVAEVYASGRLPQGGRYIAMELLRGYSLRNVIKAEGRVPTIRALSYAWQTLQGLSATHEHGVLHRDLKPANLMLEPSNGPAERVVLIDFGFALFQGAAKVTQRGQVVGSLSYMSPERLYGKPCGMSSDLYSVGVILYEMLTGATPFDGLSEAELIRAQLHNVPVPVRKHIPELPVTVEGVIMDALEKTPNGRPQSAGVMADALERAAQDV